MVVHVDETTPIRGVMLTFFGRMNIYWKKIEGGATMEFAEIEDYLDEKVSSYCGFSQMYCSLFIIIWYVLYSKYSTYIHFVKG